MSLNIAAPPSPHTTILSSLTLTSHRNPIPATSLSAVCVSSLISLPVRNISILRFFKSDKFILRFIFSQLPFLYSEYNMLNVG